MKEEFLVGFSVYTLILLSYKLKWSVDVKSWSICYTGHAIVSSCELI